MRSEGNRLLEAVDELLRISREASIPAQIYHLKAAGQKNWTKMEQVITKVDSARRAGGKITADMYAYTAGATGLDAAMPPWVQEGGYKAWAERLKDPAIRARVIREMRTPTDAWENLMLAAGSPDRVILVGFKADSLKYLTGKTLAEVSKTRGKSPEETAIDLVIADGSRVGTVYFLMSEDNVRRQLGLPWVAIDSDAEAPAPEGVFLKSNPHPRAYGTFARFLGKYVRDERVTTLEDAIRRLTAFPAENLKLHRRGIAARRELRRRRRIRSRENPGPRDLRQAAPAGDRCRARIRERHPGAQGRRAHGRQARTRRARAGVQGSQVGQVLSLTTLDRSG